VIFAMAQIARCGLNHNPIVALLRPFNKPLLYDTKLCLVASNKQPV